MLLQTDKPVGPSSYPPTTLDAHLTMALRAASIAWLASCAGESSADSSPTASGGVSRQLPGEPDLRCAQRNSSYTRATSNI
jgi:hypothetical protein